MNQPHRLARRLLVGCGLLAVAGCSNGTDSGQTASGAPSPAAPAPDQGNMGNQPTPVTPVTPPPCTTGCAGTPDGGGTSGGAADGGSTPNTDGGGNANADGGAAAPSNTLFPGDSYWYRDVSNAPVSSESAGIISAIGSWGNGNHFDVDFSFNVEHADANTTRYTASLDPGYDPDNDHDTVPVPTGGALEGESAYVCTGGGDCHLLVIDDSKHMLYEIWQANFASNKLTGTQETAWNLLTHYTAQGRGYGCTSADAAGLPIVPGLIGVKETLAGKIGHAMRYILPNTKIRSAFVAPATHLTNAASSSGGPPYGTRLRLKSSFDESSISSSGGKTVVRALKQYGMFLADGGQTPISAETDQLYGANSKWTGVLETQDLRALQVSDFEVVEFTTPRTDSDCVRYP